jgi:tRNA G18 (ribose-2'-O)-methylase SpoU
VTGKISLLVARKKTKNDTNSHHSFSLCLHSTFQQSFIPNMAGDDSIPSNHDVPSSDLPQVTVLIENPRKNTNWGPLLRCCTAFGITQIFVVGFDKCSVEGSHGAYKHVELLAFHSHEAALKALKEELGFTIVGLLQGAPESAYSSKGHDVHCVKYPQQEEQIVLVKRENVPPNDIVDISSTPLPPSYPLHTRPFSRRICLAVGKRPRGLPLSLAQLCDTFVHIPHFGLPTSPSSSPCYHDSSWLTAEASMSIVLHEFALWAGYGRTIKDDSTSSDGKVVHYQGQKYDVAQKHKGESGADEILRKKEERRAQREQDAKLEGAFQGNVFGSAAEDDAGDY